jgi:hypothetical protein
LEEFIGVETVSSPELHPSANTKTRETMKYLDIAKGSLLVARTSGSWQVSVIPASYKEA